MLFKKPFSKLEYSDLEKLKSDEIPESEILEYKQEYNENEKNNKHKNNLLKQVAAFSNSSGGFLIYGIEETDGGRYPKQILGIDKNINLERLEQKIISRNIQPRINVQIQQIDVPDSEKIVLVIRIPEGQNQPYYNNIDNKYYKRYNFEAKAMDEHEIESLYQKRFFGVGRLAKYVEDAISFNSSLLPIDPNKINAHIIITPLRVDEKIFDTSNMQELNFNTNDIKFEPNSTDSYLHGIASPSRYGIKWRDAYRNQAVEIHRNGLIHHMEEYGDFNEQIQLKELWDYVLAVDLLRTIQFSGLIYSTLDFIGKVKIILKLRNTDNSNIIKNRNRGYTGYGTAYSGDDISIEREWDSWRLDDEYLEIGKSIMDELSNHYGLWESPKFYEEDNIIKFKKK
jgi:hypothetical protein